MADVEIRFTGDGADAQAAALDIDRALEQIKAIAEQVTRALGGVELKPGATASVVAGSAVMAKAMRDVRDLASEATLALHEVKMSPTQAAEVAAEAAVMSAALDGVSASARRARTEMREVGTPGVASIMQAAWRLPPGQRRGGLGMFESFGTSGAVRGFSDFDNGVRTFLPGSGVGALETDPHLNRGGGSVLRDIEAFFGGRGGGRGGYGGTRTGGGGFQRGDGALAGILPGGARATPAALGILAMAGLGAAPQLGAPLVGLAGAIPAYVTTGVAALGTLALAFHGVTSAIGGNVKAFDELTPQAQQFALMIRGLDPLMERLQSTAQKAMFPGLTQGLQSFLNPGTQSGLNRTVGLYGSAIGGIGSQWGGFLGSQGMQQQLGQLATAGAGGLQDLSHVLMNVADAFTRVGVAALPLTNWFGNMAVKASNLIDRFVQTKQASGELGSFFTGLQAPISMVGHLIENLGKVVYELAAVLNGGGKIALQGLVDLLGGLAGWLQKNQKELSALVSEIVGAFVGALRTILPLVGDIATALAGLFKWVSQLPGPFRQIADAAIIAGIVALAGGFSTLGLAIGAIAPAIKLAVGALTLMAANPEIAALLAAMTALGYLAATGGQTDNFSSSSNPYGPPSTNVESLSPRRKKLAEEVIGYRNKGLSDAQIKTKMMKGHSGTSGYDLDIAQAMTDASALQNAPSDPKKGSYTYAQLEALWIQAGGDPSLAPTMAAIALAESGGHPGEVGYDKNKQGKVTQVDRGLWQIGSVHGYSAQSSLDPWQNAQQAVSVYNTQGLNAWSTYTSGAYLSHMGGSGGKGTLTPGTPPMGTSSKGALPIQMQIALQNAANQYAAAQGTTTLADDRKTAVVYKAQISKAEAYLRGMMPKLNGQDLLDASTELGSLISTWNSIGSHLSTAAKKGRASLSSRLASERSGKSVLASISTLMGPASGLISGNASDPLSILQETPVATAQAAMAAQVAKWKAQIAEFEKELKNKLISADAVATINNRIDQIKTKVSTALESMKQTAQQQAQDFKTVWDSYVQSFDTAFQQQTQDILANPEKYPNILPLSAALADLTDQHTQAQLQQRLQDAQKQLADAMSGAGNDSQVLQQARDAIGKDALAHALDVAQSAILGGKPMDMTEKIIRDMQEALTSMAPDPAAVKQAQQSVEDAQYEIKVNGLQKQAAAEQTAYQRSRSELQNHLDVALAMWGTYYQKSGMTAMDALNALNALLVQFGFQPIQNPWSPGSIPTPPGTAGSGTGDGILPSSGRIPTPGKPIAMAAGGLVTSPHYLVDMDGFVKGIVGEAGTEMVVPVSRSSQSPYATSTPVQSGDTHVQVNIAPGYEWLAEFVDVRVEKKEPQIGYRQGVRASQLTREGRVV